jgi:DNA-binding CsgD family transcriptional regulator/predicted Ser/Thr protein kinase
MLGLAEGAIVGGCRIDAVAGRGGMGVVYRATQVRLDRTVALKVIAPQFARDDVYRARFRREAQLAASIEHPNVLPVYEAGELDTGELYLVMRWVEGTDLKELLATSDRLSASRAVELLAPVARALGAAHARGLVHRDVKPANVLICASEQGLNEHIYLTDFGIARGADESLGLTKSGVLVGTVAYSAPERIQGQHGEPSSDLYSLGCVLFEALTGRPPFNRDTELRTMNAHVSDPSPSVCDEVPDVPPELDRVVQTALAKDPAARFSSATEMAAAMDGAVTVLNRAIPAAGDTDNGARRHLTPSRTGVHDSDWEGTFEALTVRDSGEGLGATDLEELGEAAWWLSRLPECISARERSVAAYAAEGHPRQAALVALRLFYTFSVRGESPIASGWLRRATRLLEGEAEGVEHGQLALAEARVARARGDSDSELAAAQRAIALGHQFGDPDLVALGQYIEGRLLVRRGDVHGGMATLDEAMLSATQGELGPMATGQVYCNVIAACQELGDLRRAGEWTQALQGWCENQPASVFPGLCRVHRAEVLRLRGEWEEAEREASQASEDLLEPMPAFASEALYQLGELQRQRGELDAAEATFKRASELGHEPQPGLALVRLARGNRDAAAASVRRALAQESNRLMRARLLSAQVEIAIAGDDLPAAKEAAEELAEIALEYGSVALEAAAALAQGRVDLAAGQAQAALPSLHRAWELWQTADCPFEAAETRRAFGLACRELGDADGAELALSSSLAGFEQLGAKTEARRTADQLGERPSVAGLTPREIEVLRLVAAGKSNPEIAAELYLSAKTIARHLSNIFYKINVSSRTAAAAFAYEHGLIDEQ